MPFQSKAQNAWGHTPTGTKALGGAAKVKEWERATDYSHLPEHKGMSNKGHSTDTAHYAKGGAVLRAGNSEFYKKDPQERGRLGQFLGTRDTFTGHVNTTPDNSTDENWGKNTPGVKGDGGPAAPTPKGKSMQPIKPRG